jgi:hypothetical protein
VVYIRDVDRDLVFFDNYLPKLVGPTGQLTWEQRYFFIRMKTLVNDQYIRLPLAKRMKEIAEGKVKLINADGKKRGWTTLTTQGIGRGKAPRQSKKRAKQPI